jgi:hypothetical protein
MGQDNIPSHLVLVSLTLDRQILDGELALNALSYKAHKPRQHGL